MKKKLILLLVAVCLVSVASAATVWNPVANGIVPPAVGNWGDPCNWTIGLPSATEKAVFNVPDAADCEVTDAQSMGRYLVQGDGGPGGLITVRNGGSLTQTEVHWSAIGYSDTAHMVVEAGGSVSFGEDLLVGMTTGGVGTIDLNGGTINVAGMFRLGGFTGGTGYANINCGTLNLGGFTGDSIVGDSLMDIELGVVVIDGNVLAIVQPMIYPPVGIFARITAYDGTGTVHYDYDITNPGKTTIWAEPGPTSKGNGDVNGDCCVDATDLLLFADEWLDPTPDFHADFTGDGKVNNADFAILAASWLN